MRTFHKALSVLPRISQAIHPAISNRAFPRSIHDPDGFQKNDNQQVILQPTHFARKFPHLFLRYFSSPRSWPSRQAEKESFLIITRRGPLDTSRRGKIQIPAFSRALAPISHACRPTSALPLVLDFCGGWNSGRRITGSVIYAVVPLRRRSLSVAFSPDKVMMSVLYVLRAAGE